MDTREERRRELRLRAAAARRGMPQEASFGDDPTFFADDDATSALQQEGAELALRGLERRFEGLTELVDSARRIAELDAAITVSSNFDYSENVVDDLRRERSEAALQHFRLPWDHAANPLMVMKLYAELAAVAAGDRVLVAEPSGSARQVTVQNRTLNQGRRAR